MGNLPEIPLKVYRVNYKVTDQEGVASLKSSRITGQTILDALANFEIVTKVLEDQGYKVELGSIAEVGEVK